MPAAVALARMHATPAPLAVSRDSVHSMLSAAEELARQAEREVVEHTDMALGGKLACNEAFEVRGGQGVQGGDSFFKFSPNIKFLE
jgi:hypothetical protein